uniref:Putative heat shock factor hsf-type dna-binding domain-containing protein n=1 Tax=Lutzomyia longipalpis TaxID=7200 RepID=A0A7G3AIC0_LUTLO
MCLPFELRFLGTCLEELGRRDSQELRGIELRVNNPTELAADIASCQSGEPTDMKIRRKMALYLALIRVCSRPCVNELFRTLDAWGERDLSKFNDGDPLQELLLVYTMATNHPVFSFEQRMKCAEIFTKIKESRPASQPAATVQHHISPQQPLLTNSTPSPPGIHTMHHHQLMQSQIPLQFTQMIPGGDPQLATQIMDPTMMQLPPGMTIQQHDFTVGPPPTTVPWTMRHGANLATPAAMQQQPTSLDTISLHTTQPAQSTSPLLSQPSSPTQSRSTSPTRSGPGSSGSGIGTNLQQPQGHMRAGNQQQGQQQRRVSRRPSVETTPPPPMPAPPNYVNLLGSDILVQQQNHKNFEEMMLNVDGALNQLQTICRNGYTRPAHTIPRQPTKGSGGNYSHQQAQSTTHQNHHQSSNFSSNLPGLTYALNNMAFDNVHHQVKSGGSDSGSSVGSAGDDLSPPDTPSAMPAVATTSRLRPDKLHIYTPPAAIASPAQTATYGGAGVAELCAPAGAFGNGAAASGAVSGGTVSSSGGNMVLMTQPQFQTTYPAFRQPPPLMAPQQITSPTTIATTTTFRHPYQLQPNGEFLYPYTPTAQIALLNPPSNVVNQAPPPMRSSPSLQQQQQQQPPQQQQHFIQTYPNTKMVLSCFNCGSQLHTGRDCQESSMEDATRGAIYKLDYNTSTTSATQTSAVDSVTNATANASNQDVATAPSVATMNK